MQIHEITKRRNIDEGVLDGIKNAVSSAKTGFNHVQGVSTGQKIGNAAREVGWNSQQNKINKQASKAAKRLAAQGFNVDTATPQSAASTPANIKAGTAGPQFQYNNLLAQFKAAFVGPQPGTNAPAANTMSAAPVSKTNTAKPGNPNIAAQTPAANTMSAAPVSKTNTAKPGNPNITGQTPANTMSAAPVSKTNTAKPGNPNIAAQAPANTMSAAPVSKTNTAKPGNPNIAAQPATQASATPATKARGGKVSGQVSQTPNAVRKRAARIKEDAAPQIKDIETDFPAWIDAKIPGLSSAKQDPKYKQKLDQIFSTMLTAKTNPSQLMSSFEKYVSVAQTAANDPNINSNPQGDGEQGDTAQGDTTQGGNSSDFAPQQLRRELPQLGITPKIAQTISQKLSTGTNQNDLITAIQQLGSGRNNASGSFTAQRLAKELPTMGITPQIAKSISDKINAGTNQNDLISAIKQLGQY